MENERFISDSRIKFVILGAGKPHNGEVHSSLRTINADSRVLDWIFAAVSHITKDLHFIGGYEIEKVMQKYGQIQFTANPRWEYTKSVGSFFTLELSPDHNYFVSYSDIVFRTELVEKMRQYKEDIVVAIDSKWRARYYGRSENEMCSKETVHILNNGFLIHPEKMDAISSDYHIVEFLGLIYFPHKVIPYIRELAAQNDDFLANSNMSALIDCLLTNGWRIKTVDAEGEWAEINIPGDLSQFILGTKAQTLERLSSVIKKSRMQAQISFTISQWQEASRAVIGRIQKKFPQELLAIRSSALNEDGFCSSNAGAYRSILNVQCDDIEALAIAIDAVIESYGDRVSDHQILVQSMLKDVKCSGVIFTRTLDCAAPYYTIEYDATSGRTDTVTQGSLKRQEALVLRRNVQYVSEKYPSWITCLIEAVREIEDLVGYDALDIEFAVDSNDCVFVLQVRPIVTAGSGIHFSDEEIEETLKYSKEIFSHKRASHPLAPGKLCIFGIMPDWNPAEIIGTRPRMLASTLYQYLITDHTWALQRAQFGYRDVRPYPLMHFFAGHPYIDTRASFHSFVPSTLPDSLAEKLVDFYLFWLNHHPELHDKVEFEVLPTCFSFSFDRWEDRLRNSTQFSITEINSLKEALLDLTNNAFSRYHKDIQLSLIHI